MNHVVSPLAPRRARSWAPALLGLILALAACDNGTDPLAPDAAAAGGHADAGLLEDAEPGHPHPDDGAVASPGDGGGVDGHAAGEHDAAGADGHAAGGHDAAVPDGLTAADGGGVDAGHAHHDDAAAADAGGSLSLCAASYAGCATYTDATASGASRTITFATAFYSPKCLMIKVGQTVTFSGSFNAHPLREACGPASAITATSGGATASFTFDVPGDYGYYCTAHGAATGSGMAGSIRVVP